MILFHGSNVPIEIIDLSKSRPGKDFGRGFYLSEDKEEEWARFVYDNRENFTDKPIHQYDIIYGPIANDRVGAQIRNFKNGNIDIEELINRIKYLKGITFQYYFGTEAAIKTLHKL